MKHQFFVIKKKKTTTTTTMINNNLDFEKSSNSSSSATTTPDSFTTKITSLDNSNSDVNNSLNIAVIAAPTKATTTTATTATGAAATRTAANDNSYFNRFDNRIAANLAAVINGSRFRSSSCSKSATASRSSRTTATATATTTTTKAPSIVSNRAATLTLRGLRSQQQQQQQQQRQLNADGLESNNARPSVAMTVVTSADAVGRRRPTQLLFATQPNLNCNDNEKVMQTPSSDEDNSPTELNNCKRLADKPPLVKRLTMGLMRSSEESRPLMNNLAATSNTSTSTSTTHAVLNITNSAASAAIYSNGCVNEEALEPATFIASMFGDSCRQSLTAIPMLDTLNLNDNSEFNLKKRYLRETSSANSSPKIVANRLRLNGSTAQTHPAGGSLINASTLTAADPPTIYPSATQVEAELKEAPWFQAGISRDIAIEVLANKSPGAFLVRRSTSKPGCYALTLRVPSPPGPKTTNYMILATARGYKIKGFRKEFSSLRALITHHSVMPELLPVPLAMPRPTNMTSSRRNLDDFDTYDSLQMLLKYLRAKNMEHE